MKSCEKQQTESLKQFYLRKTDYGFFKAFKCPESVHIFEVKIFSSKKYLVDALFNDNESRMEVNIGEKKSESRTNLKMAEFMISYSENTTLSLPEILLGIKILL